VGFAHHLGGLEAEELEDVGVADVEGGLQLRILPRQLGPFLLVQRQTGTLVVEAGNLALELAHRPVAVDARQLVEGGCVTSRPEDPSAASDGCRRIVGTGFPEKRRIVTTLSALWEGRKRGSPGSAL